MNKKETTIREELEKARTIVSIGMLILFLINFIVVININNEAIKIIGLMVGTPLWGIVFYSICKPKNEQ